MAVFAKLRLGTERYPALTGIRAVGASAVFFDHFPIWPGSKVIINVLAFFFVLSGFLIVRIYYQQVEIRRGWLAKYFVNRFARIYPVYFLLLTIAVCLHGDFHFWLLIKNYTLTHALFGHTDIIIEPSWSLTVEECFYALAPLFMIVARRHAFSAVAVMGGLLLTAALLVSRLHCAFLPSPMFVLTTTFFGHSVEFLAGVYLALAVIRLEKKEPIEARGAMSTLTGLAGVVVLTLAMAAVYRHAPLNAMAIVLINNFLIPVPIAVLYWGLLRENTILSRFLSSHLCGMLGRSSYSFYLLHMLIIGYVGTLLLSTATAYRPLWVALTFGATWVISAFLYMFYEEPLNVRIRKFFLSARPSGIQVAA
jgi:peptidoglycan/LPS O-acetylase OafA/YrhL